MSCSGPSDVSGARCGALNLKGPVTMALAVFRQFDHTISLARDFARSGTSSGTPRGSQRSAKPCRYRSVCGIIRPRPCKIRTNLLEVYADDILKDCAGQG